MIPRTIHNLGAHECISAMQKFIRRGMEREAMEMAVELGHTSKGFATWVTTRLEIISHEDVGLAAPEIIPLVRTCCEQARAWWNADKLGQWRMPIGTAIRALARAAKSREGDHFQAAVDRVDHAVADHAADGVVVDLPRHIVVARGHHAAGVAADQQRHQAVDQSVVATGVAGLGVGDRGALLLPELLPPIATAVGGNGGSF
jgi:replication-associated recombination protein RarA